jgi:NitT/TauT family transport system substrate-binding protein
VAEDLLKGEGFTNVQYIDNPGTDMVEPITAGVVDIGMQFSGPIIFNVDAGKPLTLLAGVHVGCFVLFGTERVNRIGDLKGQTLAVSQLNGSEYVFLSSMLAYVGLNPTTDVTWTTLPRPEAQQRFKDGKIDAVIAFPPAVQELQAKKIGHMVVNSMVDKPWSEYFCCMVVGRQEFVQRNPVATKRALRAILNATDIVARAPERAAKLLVDRGFTTNYDYALQAMRDIPYNTWREYDPGDTLRFYALRLREAGMINSSPDEIIAKSTDWRFLNELKQELPAPMPSVRNSGLLCHVGEPG